MPSNTAIIFDLDGVIADSLAELFTIYLEVTAEFEVEGSKEEFNQLNGPSLPEICAYLIEIHSISVEPEILLDTYKKKLSNLSHRVPLIRNATDTIRLFYNLGFTLCLASASPRNYINDILQRFHLGLFFTEIISGDDVTKAKPDPEIYLQAKKSLDASRYFVVEDSAHGICSAKAAGLTAIQFCHNSALASPQADYTIVNLRDLETIIFDQNVPVSTIAVSHSITLSYQEDCVNVIDCMPEIEPRWLQAKANSPSLFNGSVMTYLSHEWNNNQLNIQVGKSDYKTQWAKRNIDNSKMPPNLVIPNIIPIGVSGLIVQGENQILIGRRHDDLSTYPGYWETVPAGTLPVEALDYCQHLLTEFEEETGLDPGLVLDIRPFSVTYDNQLDVVDINCIVNCEQFDLRQLTLGEYQDFKFISIDNFENDTQNIGAALVPNSLKLLCLYRQIARNLTRGLCGLTHE